MIKVIVIISAGQEMSRGNSGRNCPYTCKLLGSQLMGIRAHYGKYSS